MRMFSTPEGDAGFALKGDDIVSVFKHPSAPYRNVTRSMLDLATDQGGRRLDAFDTVLPTLYSQSGFRAVARTPFNDQYKPEGWDYDQFKNHNKGRPDVVFMVHDPQAGLYSPWDGRTVSEYDHGAVEQDHALNQIRKRGNVPAAPGPESYGSGQLIRLGGGQAPTTIWHGTPHTFSSTRANPLGEFDIGKIGTGEGNQSYVYGPYAAGNDKVAKDYQEGLSGGTVTYKGQPSPGLNYRDAEGAAVSKIAEYMRDHDIPAEQAIDQVRRQYADSHAKWQQYRLPDRDTPASRANQRRAEFHRDIADAAGRMDPNDFAHDKGNLYQAELHIHPDHMLDWDQDIERQSPYIQERLRDVVEPWKHMGGITGEFAHAILSDALNRNYDKVKAARELLRRGIPGVRYADQHSRKHVQDAYDIRRNAPTSPLSMDESERLAREAESRITHNYVVLDPRTIDIVRRNGLPAMVAAGADALRDHKRGTP